MAFSCAVALLLLSSAAPVRAAASAGKSDESPKLISTTGGAKPKWSSIDEIKCAAEKGDPAACNEYAILLEQGQQVPVDFTRALGFYETAAKAGVRESNFRLGTIYHDGLGVTQDYAKAFMYYKQAAYAGDSLAQYNVGSMLVSARGMKRDWVEGLAWIIIATQNGADADGEKQIRARLASRPETIAAAEKRAQELRVELVHSVPAIAPTSPLPMASTPAHVSPTPVPSRPLPSLSPTH